MQLFTKNIWRKAKYYVILQPIKNIFKILLSSLTIKRVLNSWIKGFETGLYIIRYNSSTSGQEVEKAFLGISLNGEHLVTCRERNTLYINFF